VGNSASIDPATTRLIRRRLDRTTSWRLVK
jgi:hypothetical protein